MRFRPPGVRRASPLCALLAVTATGCSTFSYEPAGEQEFQQISSGGCRNRDGDFIIRGFVSNADEDTVVLNDPDDARSTISLSLPGRGPLERVKGVFGRNKYEATAAQLDDLREERIPVVVTLRCQGDGTPIARSLSYVNEDGDRKSISYCVKTTTSNASARIPHPLDVRRSSPLDSRSAARC